MGKQRRLVIISFTNYQSWFTLSFTVCFVGEKKTHVSRCLRHGDVSVLDFCIAIFHTRLSAERTERTKERNVRIQRIAGLEGKIEGYFAETPILFCDSRDFSINPGNRGRQTVEIFLRLFVGRETDGKTCGNGKFQSNFCDRERFVCFRETCIYLFLSSFHLYPFRRFDVKASKPEK